MAKKISLLLLGIIVVFSFFFSFVLKTEKVFASGKEANIYFFWGDGCPHCAKEKPFLEKLEKKYPEVKVFDFEVWGNSENRQLLIETGKKLNANVSGVPFTVVGEKYFVGWYDEKSTGASIEGAVQWVLRDDCRDVVGELLVPKTEEKSPIPQKIKVPLIGEIETENLSLPVLSVVLGGLDGFNPCAMWTLLFLISLLLGMKDRKRMWILGSAFIFASAAVYFLFMAAWLNLLLFIGFIVWIRVIIGLLALGGGIYNLREFFVNKASCKVTGDEKRQRVFEKLKAITQKRQFWLALGGIIILAAAVNLVELICSAGLPVVFTQILALSNLAKWQYYLYMLLYIFFFMLDDLVVFFAAMITLQLTGITTKYTRFSHLIGGILMVIIGILLILKPELLMFG